jgi:ABC-type branched-subunit amino acid transport system permease subunit
MASVENQPGRIPAVLAIVAIGIFAALLLLLHDRWGPLIVVAAGAVILAVTLKTGAAARAERSFAAHERSMSAVAVAVFLAVLLALGRENFALLMLCTVLLYGIACLGLNIQLGYCGVINFAGAAFFGAGSYTAAVLAANTALPHLLVLAAGGVVAGLLGSVLLLPLLRTRGHYAALITVAFGVLFRSFLEVNDTLGGPQGLVVPGLQFFGWSFNQPVTIGGVAFSFYLNYALLILVLAIVAFVLTRRLERSWIGMNLDAVRIDEVAASTFGLNVPYLKIMAFVIGNAFAGVAGAVFAMMTGFVSPNDFDFSTSLVLLAIVVLGGIGNPWGILPAAALVIILPEKLQSIQEYRFLLYSIAVVAILLFRPAGLFPRRLRRFFPRERAS